MTDLRELLRGLWLPLVTPLRDGMNLVAKEYVAAQDAEDPGVLILSRFAGAAVECQAALLVNPYDQEAVAAAIEMIEERLAAAVERDAPDGDRHHLGARRAVCALHLVETAVLPRPDDEPRRERAPGDLKFLGLLFCDCGHG